MSQGDDAEKPGSPKMPPPAVPRAKPSVPGAKPPPPAAKAKDPPPELNPFLPPESQGKLSASKIDAGWGDATELEPASSDWVDSEAVIPAASAKIPAAAPPKRPPPPPRSAPQVAPPEPIVEPAERGTPPLPPAEPPAARDSEVPSEPFKKKSRGKLVALLFLALAMLGGGGYAYQQQEAARLAKLQVPPPPPTQTVAEPVLTAEPPPPPTHMPDPPPPSASVAAKPPGGAAPAVSIDPAKRAYLDATQVPPGRKIIVDGAVYGSTPRKVAVRCGVHRVQIGDLDPESIDFPCGGEVSFTE